MTILRSAKILLASDLHGSNACYSKLAMLAKRDRPDFVILAGDLSGKSVKVAKQIKSDEYEIVEEGRTRHLSSESFRARRRDWGSVGIYTVVFPINGDVSETELRNLLARSKAQRITEWLDHWRLNVKTPLVVIPGNDDPPEVDAVLMSHDAVVNVDQRVVALDGFTILGLGYSTPTPWKTYRELSDDEVGRRLRKLGGKVEDWRNTITVIHVPPRNSGLDNAEVEIGGGGLLGEIHERMAVGSEEVRTFAREFQPRLLVSGHCHDSRGFVWIGDTACVNAGSMFHAGQLATAWIVLSEARTTCQFRLL